jgi:hypothetical protein
VLDPASTTTQPELVSSLLPGQLGQESSEPADLRGGFRRYRDTRIEPEGACAAFTRSWTVSSIRSDLHHM